MKTILLMLVLVSGVLVALVDHGFPAPDRLVLDGPSTDDYIGDLCRRGIHHPLNTC